MTTAARRPSLAARILWWLGLRFLEEVSPVHPLADPEPRWCSHAWPVNGQTLEDATEAHVCELPAGHGAPEHMCDCGNRVSTEKTTEKATDRLLRLVKLPPTYDECLWPEDGVCPRHDQLRPWPAGRDCLGVCTSCNAGADAWHAPSCSYYDPAAQSAADQLDRGE